MSIRHPEFCELVEKLSVPGWAPLHQRLSDDDLELLEEYAAPVDDNVVSEDVLGHEYREMVEELTGSCDERS